MGISGIILVKDNIHTFDVIGDIHGCIHPLLSIVKLLGYQMDDENILSGSINNRRLVFLGDLVDRGPNPLEVFEFVMNACERGNALAVLGNHDDKLMRKMNGRDVHVSEELRDTLLLLDSMEKSNIGFSQRVKSFLGKLPHQMILDDGKVVLAHGGMPEHLQGTSSSIMRRLALYGDVTGKMNEKGEPIRLDWVSQYAGERYVIYGHSISEGPVWRNKAINIDTGCFRTGILTAVQWPEQTVVSVVSIANEASAR